MSYFTSFMQKASCAAADQSAAAGFACGSFRITMDAVLCAVSIFAILALLTAIVGICSSRMRCIRRMDCCRDEDS